MFARKHKPRDVPLALAPSWNFATRSTANCQFNKDPTKDVPFSEATKCETKLAFTQFFYEQGTSASHLAAAKFIDAIARFSGCDGENADASSAYTQVALDELEKASGLKSTETWISLPLHMQPQSWTKYKHHVLIVVLYQ